MKRHILAFGLAAACLVPAAGRAGTVTATFDQFDPAGTAGVTVQLDGSDAAQSNQGGVFKWTGSDNYFFEQKAGYLDKEFLTFCLEVNQHVGTGTTYSFTSTTDLAGSAPVGGLPAMGTKAANALTKLWGFEMPQLKSAAFSDRDEIAAMQLAIWEIVTDLTTPSGVFNLAVGRLTAMDNDGGDSVDGDAIIARAKALFDANQGYQGFSPTLVALTSRNHQDQLTAVRPVPEPTSMVAWCMLGLIGLFSGRRMRSRRRS